MNSAFLGRPSPDRNSASMAGDHDLPYTFGKHVCTSASFPFSTREFARLLVLRGRIQDGLFGSGDSSAQELDQIPLG